jgi:dephospho-CoA kinase
MVRKVKNRKAIAITGGIGCGQSTLAAFFREDGAEIIDADKIGHDLLSHDEGVKEQILHLFGQEVMNDQGQIDRGKLGKMVFRNAALLEKFNYIVHPRLIARTIEQFEGLRQRRQTPFIGIDAALIYEWQMEHLFDLIICVSAPKNVRLARLQERSKLSLEEIEMRLRGQLPLAEKEAWADAVIPNGGTVDDLRESYLLLKEYL